MLEMNFIRVQPVVSNTNNNVIAFIIGAVGRDTETNKSAYIDTRKDVPETNLKPLSEWTTEEIRQFCIEAAVEQDWYTKLALQIDRLNSQPTILENINNI